MIVKYDNLKDINIKLKEVEDERDQLLKRIQIIESRLYSLEEGRGTTQRPFVADTTSVSAPTCPFRATHSFHHQRQQKKKRICRFIMFCIIAFIAIKYWNSGKGNNQNIHRDYQCHNKKGEYYNPKNPHHPQSTYYGEKAWLKNEHFNLEHQPTVVDYNELRLRQEQSEKQIRFLEKVVTRIQELIHTHKENIEYQLKQQLEHHFQEYQQLEQQQHPQTHTQEKKKEQYNKLFDIIHKSKGSGVNVSIRSNSQKCYLSLSPSIKKENTRVMCGSGEPQVFNIRDANKGVEISLAKGKMFLDQGRSGRVDLYYDEGDKFQLISIPNQQGVYQIRSIDQSTFLEVNAYNELRYTDNPGSNSLFLIEIYDGTLEGDCLH